MFSLFTLLKKGQVNFIVQLSTFLSWNTDYGLTTKPILSYLVWLWHFICSQLFFSPSSLCRCCTQYCRCCFQYCIEKIIILGYVIQKFIGSWLVFESLPFQASPLLTILNKVYCVPAVQTTQIQTWELNQGPWDLQHSTLTTRLQQLVKVGCSNPTDTILLLFAIFIAQPHHFYWVSSIGHWPLHRSHKSIPSYS